MTTTAETVEVTCSRCGETFLVWQVSTADDRSAVTCPTCGYRQGTDPMAYIDAVWPDLRDDEAAER